MDQWQPGARRGRGLLAAFAVVLCVSALGLGACGSRRAPAAPPAASPTTPSAHVPRIGYLYFGAPPPPPVPTIEAFREGLAALGYTEGSNILVEYRYAAGARDRLPALAAELVALPVDVLVVADAFSIPIAREATSTIPIVMAVSGDPVAEGFAASLARPGGNLTGLSNMSPTLSGKRVELLKEAVPTLQRLAVLGSSNNPTAQAQREETLAAARALGLEGWSVDVQQAQDLAPAFAALSADGAEGLLVLPDPLTSRERRRIIALAAEYGLPAIYGIGEFVADGGLMAYGPDRNAMFRRAAAYVDKILRGEQPGSLPIEQPMRFELAINLPTAEALGLHLSPRLLRDAAIVMR